MIAGFFIQFQLIYNLRSVQGITKRKKTFECPKSEHSDEQVLFEVIPSEIYLLIVELGMNQCKYAKNSRVDQTWRDGKFGQIIMFSPNWWGLIQ